MQIMKSILFNLFIVMIVDLSFSLPGFSNLLTCSILNVLDMQMEHTSEVVPTHTYVDKRTSIQM